MRLVEILSGVPGRGKTRYARAQDSRAEDAGMRSVICSTDDFFTVTLNVPVHGGQERVYQFDPAKIAEAHAACRAKFIAAIRAGVDNIIVDNTNIHDWEFQDYAAIAKLAGDYEVRLTTFTCPNFGDIPDYLDRGTHGVPTDVVLRMALALQYRKSSYPDVDSYRYIRPDGQVVDAGEGFVGESAVAACPPSSGNQLQQSTQ